MVRRTHRRILPALLLAVVMGGLTTAAPASAAPAAPGGLTPTSSTATTSPILSWKRVGDAQRYEVQAATSSSFASPLFSMGTTNSTLVPTVALPFGLTYWRVRSIDDQGAASSWATTTFTVSSTAAPQPVSPANGTVLPQPDNPPLLTWTAVPGATSYTVEVDTDSDFLGVSSYATRTTSLLVPDPKASGTYYWHVIAQLNNGLSTAPSTVQTYTIGALPQVATTYPDENASVEDVVLQWAPVPGARTYDLLVSTDQAFNTIVDSKSGLMSTRYSPTGTYDNDQYFWKVRARNNLNETIDWADVAIHNFRRQWPDLPKLLYPADALSPSVGGDLYYQWTPVQHASRYQLDVGTDVNFSPGSYRSCFTAATTYTPAFGDQCRPAQGEAAYWRVKALDDPNSVQSLVSGTSRFIYNSGIPQPIGPANGATVAVPTLSWQASPVAERYRVIILDKNGQQAVDTTTFALSWTLTGTGALDPAKSPYTWTVQSISADNSMSPKPAGRSFTVAGSPTVTAATPLTPFAVNGGQPSVRFPNLTWEPMASAAYYRIRIGIAGSGYWLSADKSAILNSTYPYPTATDTDKGVLTPGDYDWDVRAYAADGTLLGTSPTTGRFTIADLQSVAGRRLALTGRALDAGKATCTAYLDAPAGEASKCVDLPATPVLDWEPVPQAAYYLLYVGNDRELSNMVYTGVSTTNTRWTPSQANNPSALPDSQAGQAYYWYVRPCKANGVCSPDPTNKASSATNAFNKKSPAVVVTGPANGAVVATSQVRFDWTDYLTTNQATVAQSVPEPGVQAARGYRVQVSQSASFSPLLDERVVDQPTYTAFDRTYPEGLLYWRVQAIDGANNSLTWSSTYSFIKSSPAPILTSPNTAGSGDRAFVWKPTTYAGGYQLEVYRNDDANHSPTNRVINVGTRQTAFTPDTPLPASTTAYRWRVARVDSDGRLGQWSTDMRFTSTGALPTLVQPDAGAVVNGYSSFFAWTAVSGAAQYRFERKLISSSGVDEAVLTPGLAWAPTSALSSGQWQWRVSALDSTNTLLSSTEWRPATVDNTRGRFTAVTPVRQLDTRTGLGASQRPIGPGESITVGIRGLPSSATAVVLNVTVTRPTMAGNLTVYPTGQPVPAASNLNFVKGQTVPNLVTVAVGPGGRVDLRNARGYVDAVADLAGYYTPEGISGFTPVSPTRVLDTRIGTGALKAPVKPRSSITLTIPGLPADVTAVAMNVTVTAPTQLGVITAYPAGQPAPVASNLNFVARQTVPNMVVVAVGAGGKVSLLNNSAGSSQLIADLAGYFRPSVGAVLQARAPVRMLDTRTGVGAPRAKVGAGKSVVLTLPNLPAGATAVVLNVTVTNPTASGNLIVYPSDEARPGVSNLNFVAGLTVPNLVIVPVGAGNRVTLFNTAGTVDLIADLSGSYIGS